MLQCFMRFPEFNESSAPFRKNSIVLCFATLTQREKEKRNINCFINLFIKTILYSAKNVLVYVVEDVY